MNSISYLKEKGLKHSLDVFYKYKADLILQKLMKPFLKNKPLQDIIVIESHNDFDSNGGAFYDYLIREGYNKKYKIVWLLKHPEFVPYNLPDNVEWVPLFKPSIKKNMFFWRAKYFTYDCECRGKLRNDQVAVYLSHGAVSLKYTKEYMTLPKSIDMCLTSSDFMAPIHADIFGLGFPNSKQVIVGYPVHDTLYTSSENEIEKVVCEKHGKYILWMPTFRKSSNSDRIDSSKKFPLGIPVIDDIDSLNQIKKILYENDIVLIIKIHPMQDLNDIKIRESENIRILDGVSVKKLGIDNYRLMKDCQAFISDYSSAAYDYIHLDRPIAYTTDDMAEYKMGFIVEDPKKLMAGPEIKNVNDFISFIQNIANNNDFYAEKRRSISKILYKYHDGNSAKRLVEYLGL